MNVLVTSARNIIGYTVVTSLGRKGVSVYTGDFFNYSAAFYSRYSKGYDVYPNPYLNPDEFMDSLCEIINRRRIDILMPTTDETFLIAERINELPPHVKLFLPTYEQIEQVHDKYQLGVLAEKLGICYPKTIIPQSDDELNAVLDLFDFPVLLKPNKGGGAWGIHYIEKRDKFKQLYRQISKELNTSSLMVQEYIPGRVICTGMLFNKGELKGKISYIQLREFPTSGGTATFRMSFKNPTGEEQLGKLLTYLGWNGPCQADFIISQKDGKAYLTDVNPRFWTALYQAVACGVDFPYMTFRLATGEDIEPVLDFREGVQTRWFWGDLRVFVSMFRNGKKIDALFDFIRSFKSGIKYDDFKLDDPLPFFIFPIFPIYQIIRQRSLSPTRGGF